MYEDYQIAAAALQSFNNTLAQNANAIIAAQTSEEDRKFSREMSDLSWQRNLEAWNMQNEYNLPSNVYARQLQGLQANGLNPNLVYGNSSSVSGSAGSVSPYKFEGYHSTAVPRFSGDSGFTSFLSTELLQSQIEAQHAQNRLINARADVEEARLPGVSARSDEASYRWNYITGQISEDYDAAVRANVSTEYWKGVTAEYTASLVRDKSKIAYYEAAMSEWLNTTNVPGTELTYKQYAERFKSMIPAQEFLKLKSETLNYMSLIAYRKSQGELLDLKKEYQRAVNKFAWLGRSLGNDWVNILLSGIMHIFGKDDWNGSISEEFDKLYGVGDDYQTPPTP